MILLTKSEVSALRIQTLAQNKILNIAPRPLASHAGVFRGVRFSSHPGEGCKTSSPKNACGRGYSAHRKRPEREMYVNKAKTDSVHKGENHTKVISSPPKRKEMMEIWASE